MQCLRVRLGLQGENGEIAGVLGPVGSCRVSATDGEIVVLLARRSRESAGRIGL